MGKSNRIFHFLVLSILIHWMLISFVELDDLFLSSSSSDSIPKKIHTTHKLVVKPVQPPPVLTEDIGQIVELPTPVEENKPKTADYLAEFDHSVDKETRAENFKINPDLISETYDLEENLKLEDLIDINADQHSTGAKVGNNRPFSNNLGNKMSSPSPFAQTNKDGFQKPTLSASTSSQSAGAPNNDLLNEERSDRTRLNANAYRYASYMNQIRRMVNFYWKQEIDNLDGPLLRSKYNTKVDVIINSSGSLVEINVSHSSDNDEVDDAVLIAFRHASPFPEPPVTLIKNDIVVLPSFGFELQINGAAMNYQGVDPRAGVRFPGILKVAK